MSDRSEHLIERAAAKLRLGSGVLLPDRAPTAEIGTPIATPPGPIDAVPSPPSPVTGLPPLSELPMTPAIQLPEAPPAMPPMQEARRPQQEPSQPRPFEPIRLPGMPAGVQTARSLPSAPSRPTADPVPDTFEGPIPTPARPLTRPVLAANPPVVSINPGTSASLSLSSAPGARTGGGVALGATNIGLPPSGQMTSPAFSGGMELQAPRPNAPGTTLALQPPPIVQLDALERAGMVVARTTRTRISEEYRIAIGRMLRVLHETADVQGARNVVMVTSARPGEGKSFTALNLAGSIAQNGTDAVLLVDVDPKVKPLSDQLGLGEVQGFLDLVSDPSLRPEDLLRVTAIPNLAIMPVGTRLGGAAQTIGGTASMRPIIPTITRLARRFPKHLIMLDAPPCLSTSDPHTLAPHVGQVVLVVEAERTQRTEVEAAVDLVRVCPSITLLLNKVRMTTSHTFGAYDYFGSYT